MIYNINSNNGLENYISENSDYDPEMTYLCQNQAGECFAIYGCTYASEAFMVVDEEFSLVITDEDYQDEIDRQSSADNPELEGFLLRM